ncbi:MAG: SPW repeat domain-containing protein [Candidatus Rokuibacteriota bacterium]
MVSLILGVWLMAGPAVLGYAGAAAANHQIVGPLVASHAIIGLWEVTRGLRRVNLALGVWLIATAGVFQASGVASLNGLVVGAFVAALSLLGGTVRQRYGGGWRALWR